MTSGVVVVTGAGGFIGGHLAQRLQREGKFVVGIDSKNVTDWEQPNASNRHVQLDLRRVTADDIAEHFYGADTVYALAADMGGMGFIESHKLECMLSVNISTNTMWAARIARVPRMFYASSACVYPGYRQDEFDVASLAESDAYPADAEDGYGWEKLFSERMARHFTEDTSLRVAVARLHNVYGPLGTWSGGREKAPAAICRKVASAVLTGEYEIEIWGSGRQERSYMFIDDCIDGIRKITDRGITDPINLGSSERVSVHQLVDTVEEVAGIPGKLHRSYDLTAPQGVNGRNSNNTRILDELGWEPSTKLRDGIADTYEWVYAQVKETLHE